MFTSILPCIINNRTTDIQPYKGLKFPKIPIPAKFIQSCCMVLSSLKRL